MIWLYRLLFWPLFIILLPRYLWRLWRRGGDWHIAERFGYINPPAKVKGKTRIWLHCVSVGELNSSKPFLTELSKNKEIEIVLSVTTTTAYKLAQDKFKGLYSYIFAFPIDLFSSRTLRRLNPDKIILSEGELWPELLYSAAKKIPVYLINARISDRSYRRLSYIKNIAKWLLSKVSRILTATKQDTERYISLGANPELVYQTGNLKFDTANTKPLDEESKLKLFTSLKIKENSLVILGGSTWAPEELALINAYNSLKEEFPKIQLILVPRHAERGSEVESLLKTQNISYLRRSNGYKSNNSDEFPDVILADTTGELAAITQLTDVFFVGKSLPPHKEGQSPIDSAAAGKPIIMGTGMSNFRQISQSLVDSGGGFFVGGPLELKEKIGELLRNESLRHKSGALAKKWFDKNCGATKRTIEILELSTPKPVKVL